MGSPCFSFSLCEQATAGSEVGIVYCLVDEIYGCLSCHRRKPIDSPRISVS